MSNPTAKAVIQHFVTFYSPGTFLAETTTKPIKSWNVGAAVRMASTIKERYGATPFGFRFTTRSRGPKDLDSKQVKASHMYYLNGEVFTRAQVEARNDPKEEILRSNMRCNNIERIVQKRKDAPGWMWIHELEKDDVVLP